MPTLYELTGDMAEILNQINANDGELSDDIQEKLEITKESRDRKCMAYLEIIKSKKSFISNVDEEIKRLQAIKKREVERVEWLESNLLNAVKVFGEFKVGTVTFSTTYKPFLQVDAVLLDDIKKYNPDDEKSVEPIDADYLNITRSVTVSLNKKKVTDAIKDKDEQFEHCRIAKNEYLNIK